MKQHYVFALTQYETAAQLVPNSADPLWRIARAYVCLGDIAEKNERELLYGKALDAASRAVQTDKQNSDAHTWRAIAIGYVSMYEGVRSKVKMANQIKHELEHAIELNPKNDVAYSILGTFHRAIGNVSWIERQLADVLLGGLPKGGFEEGEVALKKAIALSPNIIRHRYELGLLYTEWGKVNEAKAVFTDALHLSKTLASDEQRIQDMKKKLEEL